MYLACVYDNEWYIEIVQEVADDSDVYVKFIQQNGVNFKWPSREEKCWVPIINVLAKVNTLVAQCQSARNYQISEQEFVQISLNFEMFNKKMIKLFFENNLFLSFFIVFEIYFNII